jgi:hypothetical protein
MSAKQKPTDRETHLIVSPFKLRSAVHHAEVDREGREATRTSNSRAFISR